MNTKITEEDVRTKIAYEFLKSRGVTRDQFYFEKTITIRLGKKSKPARGRIDVLVKNNFDENLIVFEIKKPTHRIKNEDIEQALSYAKLVSGNIAPYTVIMNGKDDALVYDSYTSKQIGSKKISTTVDFQPSKACEKLKKEALEILVERDKKNLFDDYFKDFLDLNLSQLIGGINSNKKYCEELYIKLEKNLYDASDIDDKQIFLISGSPQVGKTNFLIHNAKLLALSCNVIFISAYKLNKSLNDTLQESFDNHYGLSYLSHVEVIKHTLPSKKLYFFIDGLNEVSYEKRHEIIGELRQYYLMGIKIVASCTDTFLNTLPKDNFDNPTIFSDIELVKKRKEISLHKPCTKDTERLYQTYAKAYKVSISSNHVKIKNPYLLRLAMELYQNKIMPDDIETNDVLEKSIQKRTLLIDNSLQINSRKLLTNLALAQLNSMEKISESYFCILLGKSEHSRCPEEFLTYGFLVKDSSENSNIDFYYDSIRDYLISEELFKKQSLGNALSTLSKVTNKSILKSVVYSHLKRKKIKYSDLIGLNNSIIIDIFEPLSRIFLEQNQKSHEEVNHFLNLLLMQEKHTGLLDVCTENIMDNYSNIGFNFEDHSYEMTTLIGLYIVENGFQSSIQLFNYEALWNFEPRKSQVNFNLYYYCTKIIIRYNDFDESHDELINDIISILDEVDPLINEDNLRALSTFVNDLFDEFYNGIPLLCHAPSYLEILKSDHDKVEWDEHVFMLNEIESRLIPDNLNSIHEIRKELSSLSNNYYRR